MNIVTKSVNLVPWWLRDHIRKIPLLAGFQRLVFNNFLAGKKFNYKISAGPAKGLNFPITLPDDKLIWTGTWEKQVAEKIFSHVKKDSPSFDIGSHRGFMAGIMGMAGSSHVYCFEPNPENISHLSILRKLNPNLSLEVLEYAVSNKIGSAEFSIMSESSMGKLSESSFQKVVERNDLIRVETCTLDDLLERGIVEPPGFIKIDVEGAELLVLEGAKNLIKKYFPSFVVELHSHDLAIDCKKFLEGFEYKTEIIQKEIELNNKSSFKVCHLLAIK